MYLKLCLIFVLIICTSFFSYSQNSKSSVQLLYLPQGDTFGNIYGGKFLGATNSSITNIAGGNPATINDIPGFTIGASYQFSSKIINAWIADIGALRSHNYYPQSFGISYSKNNFVFGLGYNQSYNVKIDYGEFSSIVRADNELGYIENGTFHPMRDEIIHTSSVVLSYKINHIFGTSSDLFTGIRYNYNYLASSFYNDNKNDKNFENLSIEKWEANIPVSNITVGLRYDIRFSKFSIIKLGLLYETKMQFEKKIKNDNYNIKFRGNYPDIYTGGLVIELKKHFSISANLKYYLWEPVTNSYENRNNQPLISLGISYPLYGFLISMGTIITDGKYDIPENAFNLNDSFSAKFLTAGFSYIYEKFILDMSLADSHLFSDKRWKQFILRFGIGYSIN